MISIESLLTTPLPWDIAIRALPRAPGEVSRVVLVESLAEVDSVDPGALVVLTRATVEAAGGYQFDVFVRQAVRRGATAVVLRRSTARSMTAEALATRGGVALLDVNDDVDPAAIVDELSTLVAGDARAVLRRLAAASAQLGAEDDTRPADVVSRLGAACGVALEYEQGASALGTVVELDGVKLGAVRALQPGDLAVIAARLGADAAATAIARRERLLLTPIRTTSAALAQLLLCSQTHLSAIAGRAAEIGFAVGGWHCAARLMVDDSEVGESGGLDLEQEVVTLVAEHVASVDSGGWSVARPDDSVVVVRTTRQSARREASARMLDWMRVLTPMLQTSDPRRRIRVGIATEHEGPSGLRVSAEEARTALAAANLSDETVSVSRFDALGGRRMLAEWLTTDAARETVRELLAPLDALGPGKSDTAVLTLHAYLDEQGSLQRAAKRLHVHRNAVVYRLERIRSLGFDLTDPDNRFALELACRARLMTTGRHPAPTHGAGPAPASD